MDIGLNEENPLTQKGIWIPLQLGKENPEMTPLIQSEPKDTGMSQRRRVWKESLKTMAFLSNHKTYTPAKIVSSYSS